MKTHIILLFVSFMILLTFSSFSRDNTKPARQDFVVVLDAGHGGGDPGNIGNGYREKNIALKVVLAVGKVLESKPNIKVVYTRKKDVFIELDERARIANKANADLFVSIHCNSHSSQAYGTETFVLGTASNQRNFEVAKTENQVIFLEDDYEKKYAGFDPNSPESFLATSIVQEEYIDQSIQLANIIEKNFIHKIKRKSRGVKQANFIVIHQTAMPSVLVELGFLTNNKEGPYLNSKKGQAEVAKSIITAILEYKKSLDENLGDDVLISETSTTLTNSKDIIFKVQIAASSKALETKSSNFKGLNHLSRLKEGSLYKYFYGADTSYQKAKQLEEQAKATGYTSSFIVAFKNGKKIPLIDAIKSVAN